MSFMQKNQHRSIYEKQNVNKLLHYIFQRNLNKNLLYVLLIVLNEMESLILFRL